MTNIELKVLAAIKANPLASQQELAALLGMSRESVAGYIMRLTRKGEILGKGYIFPKRRNILVIGGANVDLSGNSSSSFKDGDSNPGYVKQSAGGVGRNIAENLARLGNETILISVVGADSRGRFLVEHANEAGINTQDIILHSELATSSYLAINNEVGELIGAIADMAIIDHLTAEVLQEKLSRLHSASTIVVEANLPEETINWLSQQKFSASIIADAVSASKAPRLRALLPMLSLLKVNKNEAFAILDLDENTEISEEDIIKALLKQGVQSVILSLGNRGALFGSNDEFKLQPIANCTMVSDTGAGDALLAGYIHGINIYDFPSDRLKLGLACAAATLEASNAVNPNMSEHFILSNFENFLNPAGLHIAATDSEN